MPGHKVGRAWKFKMSEVDEWARTGNPGVREEGASQAKRKAVSDFGVDKAAMNDATFGVSLVWSPCPYLTVTPAYQYTLLVNSDIEDGAAALYEKKERALYSLKVTYTF